MHTPRTPHARAVCTRHAHGMQGAVLVLSTLALTLSPDLAQASIGCGLVAVLFALGALALLYLKARRPQP